MFDSTMTVLTRIALLSLIPGVLAPAASGQKLLHGFYGDAEDDLFGAAVSGAGDVNLDGYDDVIIGIAGDDSAGKFTGSVRVISGKDGSVLHVFNGRAAGGGFGESVSGAGDVDGDGHPDILVGAEMEKDANGDRLGTARVFSGKSGALLLTFYGDSDFDLFGSSVSDAGDVNRDGFADIVVGSPFSDNNGTWSGRAYVFSGKDGSVLHTIDGDLDDRLGSSVSGVGDLNGDGFDDLIIGAPNADYIGQSNTGAALVISGKDGTTLFTFWGDGLSHFLGVTVSGAGDTNGDGIPDMIVGARGDSGPGYARVFSGKDGSFLHTFHGDSDIERFGRSVSGAGDVNGDGLGDLIVGASWYFAAGMESGAARVFSGLDGSILGTLYGWEEFSRFGEAVSGAGDVDGDGFADVIIGAPGISTPFAEDVGSAWVHSGWKPVGTAYCTPAVPNSSGQSAVIRATGSSSVAENSFFLWATDLPRDELALFIVSDMQGFLPAPGGSQGNLCLGGSMGRFSRKIQDTGPCGCAGIEVNLQLLPLSPPHTVLKGETWNFQMWVTDTGSSNFTDAVSVTFD